MFNVRGVNIFPTAVREIIGGRPALTSGHFRIVLRGPGPYDRLEIRAEAAENVPPERHDEIAGALEAALRDGLRASAVVSVVPHGSLGRTAEKTSLVERVPA
jgi:phenylacetate-CoA ligase